MLPQYPKCLDLAVVPTAFRPLDRISEALGGPRIWIKHDDLTGSAVSGNKIRKLEFLAAEAQERNADVLVTCGGVQSNHCRATAITAARLNMKCHLLLRGPNTLIEREQAYAVEDLYTENGIDGNLLLGVISGASVSIYSPGYYGENLEREFERVSAHYETEGLVSYAIPTGGSNATGLWGYVRAAQELVNDFERENITPSSVFCATGSGGTQGGLALGFHLLRYAAQVFGVAVCDSAQYFFDKIKDDVNAWQSKYDIGVANVAAEISINTVEGYIGPGYAMGYPELFNTIEKLARLEGVILDPVYTGKAFYGMIEQIRQGHLDKDSDIVFVHTGGVFGLFPFKNSFSHQTETS